MKKNYALSFVTIFLLTFISVAYAAFNSELNITGEGSVLKDTTAPTCGSWYLRDSSLTTQEAYNQNKFINPGTNTTWTNTDKTLFIECTDNMEGDYGCINVDTVTAAGNTKRYFKDVKDYTTSIKSDGESVTVTLQDAYLNSRTCTLPVGGSNPYLDKDAPTATDAYVTNISPTGYDVVVTGVTDGNFSGVNRVQFPTWTSLNGKDDLLQPWRTSASYTGTDNGNGTWTYRVNISDHNNEGGVYITHVYTFDNVSNERKVKELTVTIPQITVTADANGGNIPSTTGWTGTGAISTKDVTYNNAYGTLPTPTKSGYDFVGWRGSNIFNPDTMTFTSSTHTQGSEEITLNAGVYDRILNKTKWVPKTDTTYTLVIDVLENTFDKELFLATDDRFYILNYGGSTRINLGSLGFTGKIVKTFKTRSDFSNVTLGSFWFQSNNGVTGTYRIKMSIFEGTTINDYEPYYITSSSNVVNPQNHTITAEWTPSTYQVIASSNGGTISSTTGWTGTGNTSTKNATYKSAYGTLPTVSRTGYTLKGWSVLPEGYTQVEYITFNESQYIDTGVPSKQTLKIESEFSTTVNKKLFFGARRISSADSLVFGYFTSNTAYVGFGTRSDAYTTTINAMDGNKHKVVLSNDIYQIDDVNQTISNRGTLANFYNIYIGTWNNAGTADSRMFNGKVYSFKIYDSEVLVRDYIPCIEESTGKVGLYDLVSGEFFGNSNSSGNDFTAGQEEYITSSSIVNLAHDHVIYAKWEANELTFADKEVSSTYNPSAAQTITNGVNAATNGSGTYTYAITGENTNNYFSLSGRNIVVAANTPANSTGYAVTITATDSVTGATKSATYTIKVNKLQCATPTAVAVSNTGVVTWTASSNCSSAQHQVKVANGSYANATSGVNKNTDIVAATGSRAVSVIAKAPNSNYSDSSAGTKSVTVYSVTLTKGTGISDVTNNGTSTTSAVNYINGRSVTIDATLVPGYSFSNWTGTSILPDKSSVITVNENKTYTANATANTYLITYDYRNTVQIAFASGETADTGYIIDWDNDFTINGVFKYGTNAKRYLVIGSYTDPDKALNIELTTANKFRILLGNGEYDQVSSTTVGRNADITYSFSWVASTHTYTFTATGTNTNISMTDTYNIIGQGTKTLKIGTRDNRTDTSPFTTATNHKTLTITRPYVYGNTLDIPDPVTKPGYNFTGWYDAATGGNAISSSTPVPASDKTYYAHWTANTFQVKFNANGGSGTMSNQSFTYDVAQALTQNAFTRTGYTFIGWSRLANGATTSIYYDKQSVSNLTKTNNGTYNLYALWQKNTYDVVFDGNGSTSGSMSDQSLTYGTAGTLTANAYNRTGYTYSNWNTNSLGTGVDYNNQDSMNINPNMLVGTSAPAVPSNTTSYAYSGRWAKSSTSLSPTQIDVTDAPSSLITKGFNIPSNTLSSNFYVYFNYLLVEPNQSYTVSVYAKGSGSIILRAGNSTPYREQSFTLTDTWQRYEMKVIPVTTNTAGTYNARTSGRYLNRIGVGTASGNGAVQIAGLKFEKAETATEYVDSTNKLNLHAEWITKTYTLTLDKNDGTSDGTTSITATYDSSVISPSSITLASKSYTISGFTLLSSAANAVVSSTSTLTSTATLNGYYTAASGGNLILQGNTTATYNSTSVTNYLSSGTWTRDVDTTLYAQFGAMPSKVLPTITKAGYTCGWTTNSSGTTIEYQSGGNLIPSGNTTLYGVCTLATYTVTANSSGTPIPATSGWTGTGNTATKSVTYDSAYGTLPALPTMTGYDVGWSLLPAGYTQLEYITFNGGYIDTGVLTKQSLKIETEFSATTGLAYFGARKNVNEDGLIFGEATTTAVSVAFGAETTQYATTMNLRDGNKHKLVLSNDIYQIDGVDQTISNRGPLTNFYNIYIGTWNNAGTADSSRFKGNVYSFKIYDSEVLVRDYIPCINESTGKAGLYDLVTNTFYSDATVYSFNKGPVDFITSSTIVKTPRNHDIYERAIPRSYRITLNKNDGTGMGGSGVTATYDSSVISPSYITLASKSYYISGFTLLSSATGAAVSSTSTLTSTASLNGYYTAPSGGSLILQANTTATYNNATVSGYLSNGKWARDADTTLYAQFGAMPSKVLPTITKTGYNCGWTTDSEGTTIEYQSGGNLIPSGNTRLYGVCTLATYTLTADATGGSIPSTTGWTGTGNTSTKNVTYGSAYGTLPTPTRPGYNFKGWTLDQETLPTLPSGYTQVEYIESNGTQYIDTGVAANTIYGLEYKYMPTGSSDGYQSYLSGTSDNFTLGRYVYANKAYLRYRTVEKSASLDVYTNSINTLTITSSEIRHNNETFPLTETNPIATTANNLYISNGTSSNKLSSQRIYLLKIYDQSQQLVRFLIPCIEESTGKVGLYDTVNEVFYGNAANSGEDFVSGSPIYKINGYTQIEYIESNGTQYINTGVAANTIYGLEYKYTPTGTTNDYQSYLSGTGDNFTLGRYYYLNRAYLRYRTVEKSSALTVLTSGINTLTITNDEIKHNSDTFALTETNPIATTSNNLYVSNNSSLNRYASQKIYSLKIYNQSQQLIRNYIPCINNSTGKAGLYDLVNGIFYGNANTSGNDFIAGYSKYITSSTIVTTASNHTIYANWAPISYTLNYNANGGTGTMAAEVKVYDSSFELTANAFTNDGYTFTGWNTAADGSGTSYDDTQNVVNLTTSTSVTLYAQWQVPGLYDSNNNLIKTWAELEALGLTKNTIEYNYTSSTYKTRAGSPYKVLNDNNLSGKLVLPSSITKIGNYAFYSNPRLTGIIIPSSVTTIGNYTFRNSTNLTSVSIGSGVTSIGTYAFYGCTGLTSITIPSSVTTIGNYAFQNTGLTEIIIPNSVTSIGTSAFAGCTDLTSVSIGSGVTSIGTSAFENCANLSTITVDSNNSTYDSRNNSNAIIKTSTNELIVGSKNTVIPNSVTSIGNNAFYGCTGLTSIVIPNSVTSIASTAFAYCENLVSIVIGSGVTSIGNQAFRNCANLSTITVDSNNSTYDSRNNSNAIIKTSTNELIVGSKNTVIPNSVTSIGSSAFYNCTGLTSIVIPNSVTSIGSSAFYGCTGLTSIVIPNSVTSIGGSAFAYCENLVSIVMGSGVTSIGNQAFYACAGLTSIVIPNSVTSIGNSAFRICVSLTSITIPASVKSIGTYAFSDCTSLASATFEGPNGWFTATSASATSGTDVTLTNTSQNATYLKSTYSSVYWIKPLYTVQFNANGGSGTMNNQYIGIYEETTLNVNSFTKSGYVFDCWNTAADGSGTSYEDQANVVSLANDNGVVQLYAQWALGAGLYDANGNIIKTWAELEALGLTVSSIENDYTSSNYSTTAGSPYKVLNDNNLSGKLVLPSSVTKIGDYAFYQNTKVTAIVIPRSTYYIGINAFSSCTNLAQAEFINSNNWYASSTSDGTSGTDLTLTSTSQNATYLKTTYSDKYWKRRRTYKIVYNANGGTGTMADQDVEVSSGVQLRDLNYTRNGYVFTGWNTKLNGTGTSYSNKAVITPTLSENEKLNLYAQWDYEPGLFDSNGELIKTWSELEALGLTKATVETDYTSSSYRTTAGSPYKVLNDNNLSGKLVLPSSITKIGNYAFYSNSRLTGIIIPSSVETLGTYCFYASRITSVTLSDGLKTIRQNAFYSISGLITITIPGSVTLIESRGLANYAFTTVNFKNTEGWYRSSSSSFTSETSVSFSDPAQAASELKNNYYYRTTAYKISFNANGGNGTMNSQYAAAGQTVSLSTNTFTKDNYSFIGWNTASDGSGTSYQNGASVSNLASSNQTVVLYAQWERIAGLFDSNGNIIKTWAQLEALGLTKSKIEQDYTSSNYSTTTGSPYKVFSDNNLTGKLMLPDGINKIGNYAFKNCPGLTSITIPEGINNIGAYAFDGCTSLTSADFISTSDWHASSTSDGTSGTSLTLTNTSQNATYLKTTYSDKYWKKYGYTISFNANGGSGTMDNQFVSLSEQTTLNKNTYTYILYRFAGWNTSPNGSGDAYLDEAQIYQLGTVDDNVILYAQWEYAFPPGLYDSNDNMIKTWAELEALGLTASTVEYDYTKSNSSTTAGSPYKVFYDNDLSGKLVLPSSVTKIGNCAFYENTGLTGIIIPNGVTSIGSNAFGDCENLVSIVMGSGVTSIGTDAFYGCENLSTITVDPNNSTYDSRNNSNAIINTSTNELILGSMNTIIPNTVTKIGDDAFAKRALTSIIIPNSVTTIGRYSFSACNSLTSIVIPDSVTSIGDDAFDSCANLTTVTIGSGVTSIGNAAFVGCSNLTSVTIGSGVTSIGRGAFLACSKLTSATFNDPNGWFVSTLPDATSGTDLTLTNTSDNATYLKTTYRQYYWKKSTN